MSCDARLIVTGEGSECCKLLAWHIYSQKKTQLWKCQGGMLRQFLFSFVISAIQSDTSVRYAFPFSNKGCVLLAGQTFPLKPRREDVEWWCYDFYCRALFLQYNRMAYFDFLFSCSAFLKQRIFPPVVRTLAALNQMVTGPSLKADPATAHVETFRVSVIRLYC